MDSFFAVPTNTTYSPFSTSSSIVVEDIIRPIVPRSLLGTAINTNTYPYVTTTTYPYSSFPHVNINANRNILLPNTGLGLGLNLNLGQNLNLGMGLSTVPTSGYYYDSGIGENPIAIHETNKDLRYKFLDKWVYDDYPDILRKLKIDKNQVEVLSKEEEKSNSIDKDTVSELEKKSDYIGYEILTLSKNKKILEAILRKNSLKWFDLPHNEYYVRKEQAKYVKKKLEDMQK